MSAKINVLIIHLEFNKWKVAKSWSYETQLGFFDGFVSDKIAIHNLLNPFGGDEFSVKFGDFVKEYVKNKKFDQVWVEIVHSNYAPDFLSFLCELAPVRVAMLGESIYYTEDECKFVPELKNRFRKILNATKYFTHVLCIDEADAASLKSPLLNTAWWVPAIPCRSDISQINYSSAIFSGAAYGSRQFFLDHKELKKYVEHQFPLEKDTYLPLIFDVTQSIFKFGLFFPYAITNKLADAYVSKVYGVRSKLFDLWIEGLQRGVAVVQLPHFVKAFPGRIYEGMAAGRPVITPIIKDRPSVMKLFVPNEEIFFYENSPDEIIEIIKKLNKDKKYAENVATNAFDKIKRLHNVQRRVEQIFKWIESDDVPNYYE
jgi:glycosyltransferase involved in cell wall biosynthesis